MNVFKGRFCQYIGCKYATDPDFYHVNNGQITLDYNCVVQWVESLDGVWHGDSGARIFTYAFLTCKSLGSWGVLPPSPWSLIIFVM